MHLRRKVCLLALSAITAISVRTWAETTPAANPSPAESGGGFTLGSDECGLGLGNVKRLTGLRLNVLDRGVEDIRGVDLSLWGWPLDANPEAEFRGLTLGGICLSGKSFTGITWSLVGVSAEQSTTGITDGGMGIVFSKNEVVGVNAALLGVYAGKDIRGLSLAPFGIIGSSERITGLNVAMFGVFAREDIVGANAGGIIGAGRDITGSEGSPGRLAEYRLGESAAIPNPPAPEFPLLMDSCFRGRGIPLAGGTRVSVSRSRGTPVSHVRWLLDGLPFCARGRHVWARVILPRGSGVCSQVVD